MTNTTIIIWHCIGNSSLCTKLKISTQIRKKKTIIIHMTDYLQRKFRRVYIRVRRALQMAKEKINIKI